MSYESAPVGNTAKTTLFLRLPEQETLTKFDRDTHTHTKNMTRVTDIKIPPQYSLGGYILHTRRPINWIVEGKKGFTVIASPPRCIKAKMRRGLRMTN